MRTSPSAGSTGPSSGTVNLSFRKRFVPQRRMPGEAHLSRAEVDTVNGCQKQAGAGLPGQRQESDEQILIRIETGNVPGQHAGVRRCRLTRDDAYPDTVQRLVNQPPQYLDVGMSAAQ